MILEDFLIVCNCSQSFDLDPFYSVLLSLSKLPLLRKHPVLGFELEERYFCQLTWGGAKFLHIAFENQTSWRLSPLSRDYLSLLENCYQLFSDEES